MSSISPCGIAQCPECGQNVQTTKGKLNDHCIGTGWDGNRRVKREQCKGSGRKPDAT